MEWLVGEWYFETTLEDNFLNLGGKGDKLTFHMVFEWGLNKNVIMARSTAFVRGKQFLEHQSTMGWDTEKKQVVAFSFHESGGRGEGTVTLENEGIIVQKVRLISPEGQSGNATVTIKRIDQFMMGSSESEQRWSINQPNAKRFYAAVKALEGGVVPKDWVKPEGPQHRVRLSQDSTRGHTR